MTDEKQTGRVEEVSVKNFLTLFKEARFPLAIDTYQRGYVWEADKVSQFIRDLLSY